MTDHDSIRFQALQDAIAAINGERLEDPNLRDPGDIAYAGAIEHAINAVRRLQAPIPKKEFSFCESTFASSRSPRHIRALSAAGRKPSGGIDTKSLCGRVQPSGGGGWDLVTSVPLNVRTDVLRGTVCEACGHVYSQEIEIPLSAAGKGQGQ